MTLTKEQRKEIVKVLQGFGFRTSKTKQPIREISFNNFKKVFVTEQEGYKWDREKSSNTLWLDIRQLDKRINVSKEIALELTLKGYDVKNYFECLIITK
tara:strand:+ start:447 stop:743 length:297 start_codon:yes stop_codon:yes gene_type:complete